MNVFIKHDMDDLKIFIEEMRGNVHIYINRLRVLSVCGILFSCFCIWCVELLMFEKRIV